MWKTEKIPEALTASRGFNESVIVCFYGIERGGEGVRERNRERENERHSVYQHVQAK